MTPAEEEEYERACEEALFRIKARFLLLPFFLLRGRARACAAVLPLQALRGIRRTNNQQILEQRLMHHEEQALQKYYALDARLRGDHRLTALTEHPAVA